MSMSELDWIDLLLEDVPAPVTAQNEANVATWMEKEEPPGQWWGGFGSAQDPTRLNPLNASVGSGTDGGISSGGLGTYPDLTTAAHYTAGMIDQPNMAGIKSALESSAPSSAFGAAVVASPWASSHYGGNVGGFSQVTNPGPTITDAQAIGAGKVEPAGTAITAGATAGAGTQNTGTAVLTSLTSPLTSSISGDVKSAGAYLILIGAGAALVVLGLFKTANPGLSIRQTATKAAGAAALAA